MINKEYSDSILVSIIIVVYNTVSTIERAINSVLSQEGQIELLIIDGGSTDGTLDVIGRYEQSLAYWVSGPDRGIYDAMNKGIEKAQGEWLYFLGADDILHKDVLHEIIPVFHNPCLKLVYGSVIYDNAKVVQSSLGYKMLLQNTIHHQAAFYHKSLFEHFRYDTNFKIIADYELNLIAYLKKIYALQIKTNVALCGSGGTSFNTDISLKETNLIRGKHIRGKLNLILSFILRMKYFLHYVLLRKI